jgi:hypothetical protein
VVNSFRLTIGGRDGCGTCFSLWTPRVMAQIRRGKPMTMVLSWARRDFRPTGLGFRFDIGLRYPAARLKSGAGKPTTMVLSWAPRFSPHRLGVPVRYWASESGSTAQIRRGETYDHGAILGAPRFSPHQVGVPVRMFGFGIRCWAVLYVRQASACVPGLFSF